MSRYVMEGTTVTLYNDRGQPVQDADLETGEVIQYAYHDDPRILPEWLDGWQLLAGALVFAAVYAATWWGLR